MFEQYKSLPLEGLESSFRISFTLYSLFGAFLGQRSFLSALCCFGWLCACAETKKKRTMTQRGTEN